MQSEPTREIAPGQDNGTASDYTFSTDKKGVLTVRACPECDKADVRKLATTEGYRCGQCSAHFDEPVVRERYSTQKTVRGDTAAGFLESITPEEFDKLVTDGGVDVQYFLQDSTGGIHGPAYEVRAEAEAAAQRLGDGYAVVDGHEKGAAEIVGDEELLSDGGEDVDNRVAADLELVGGDGEITAVSVTDIAGGPANIGQRVLDALDSEFEDDDVHVHGLDESEVGL